MVERFESENEAVQEEHRHRVGNRGLAGQVGAHQIEVTLGVYMYLEISRNTTGRDTKGIFMVLEEVICLLGRFLPGKPGRGAIAQDRRRRKRRSGREQACVKKAAKW